MYRNSDIRNENKNKTRQKKRVTNIWMPVSARSRKSISMHTTSSYRFLLPISIIVHSTRRLHEWKRAPLYISRFIHFCIVTNAMPFFAIFNSSKLKGKKTETDKWLNQCELLSKTNQQKKKVEMAQMATTSDIVWPNTASGCPKNA